MSVDESGFSTQSCFGSSLHLLVYLFLYCLISYRSLFSSLCLCVCACLACPSDLTDVDLFLGEWEWFAPGTRANLTTTFFWLGDAGPWVPAYWSVGPEDYFLFAVAGLFALILGGALVHWMYRRWCPGTGGGGGGSGGGGGVSVSSIAGHRGYNAV